MALGGKAATWVWWTCRPRGSVLPNAGQCSDDLIDRSTDKFTEEMGACLGVLKGWLRVIEPCQRTVGILGIGLGPGCFFPKIERLPSLWLALRWNYNKLGLESLVLPLTDFGLKNYFLL